MELCVATWNVHGFVGTDGLRDVSRTASALWELGADIVGLQEVDCRERLQDGTDPLDHLASVTGMFATAGPTRLGLFGFFGNALLTRWPVTEVVHSDVSVAGRERRGILSAELPVEGRRLRLVVTHFGLRMAERRAQLRGLLDIIALAPDVPLVLMGDFNEWHAKAWTLTRLHAAMGLAPSVRTFPSRAPLLALDRIWVRPRALLVELRRHTDRIVRIASDHLPVSARLDFSRLAAASVL